MNENEKALDGIQESCDSKLTNPADSIGQTTESASVDNSETNGTEAAPATEGETVIAEETTVCGVTDECAEKESPAMAIAEAADAEGNGQATPDFHNLTKEELVNRLKAIVEADDTSAHKTVTALKQAFYVLKNRETTAEMNAFVEAGNQPEAFEAAPDELEQQFKDLYAAFKEKRTQFLASEEERRQKNLEAKREIINQLRNIAEDIDNINLHFTKFQQLQQEFKAISDIPAPDVAETWKNYQLAVEQFYDRLKMNKELRDLDFKKNLEIKRGLIDEAKALEQEPDVIKAFRTLQDLHEKWRETGPVAKDLRDGIWDEFKAASTVVNKRHQEFFETRKAAETANEEAKTKLCEEIEAIDLDAINSFNEWEKMTKKIIELQGEWKKLGYAPRKTNNTLFARFRKVCDDFFARKAEYYKRVKSEFAENLAHKTRLCEEAEALRDMEDRKAALDKVQKLQAEWKTVGSVTRKHSEPIWERFTKACNFLFEERRRQNASQRQEENANLAAKRGIIEALKAINPAEMDRNEALKSLKALQAQWQSVGHVPFRQKDAVYAEYREAADALYNALSISRSQSRMNDFEDRIADMEAGDNRLGRERDRLVRACEAKKAELNTAENNLGFFNVKSSEGNSMLREMDRRIKNIKEEIKLLEQKIAAIDEKMK